MGCSVPATEHFIIDIEGRCREREIFEMSLTHIQMGSLSVSVIPYNILNALASFGVGI